jgi:predicted Zn-dependent peptidase
MTLEAVLSSRPSPGVPRPYDFPAFEKSVLASGLPVVAVHIPGRPLVSANLVIRGGAADEPAAVGGASVLAARAMTEGTERYPGVELIEAAERLGATLHADAGWDSFGASVEVPATRLGAALELLAELVERPTFPDAEVARLRDERLNDLLQVRADPRRRAEHAFAAAIYTADSPYSRPAGGDEGTVRGISRDDLRGVHRALLDPRRAVVVVGGDLSGLDVPRLVDDAFGSLGDSASPAVEALRTVSAVDRTFVRLYDRPGSVQSELRIGHMGVPRLIPDFYAVQVMASILGGLFNSRLQLNLREKKGYTYGAGAGFDARRGAGPFAARTAVHTAVTAPAVAETLGELRRIREERVTETELAAARDYLVGVFPLRFETPGAVVAAIGGLFVQGLPDDDLARYRGMIEAVTVGDVQAAAREHIDTERLAIVVVGDADAVAGDLEKAAFGDLEIVREEKPEDGAGVVADGSEDE